MTDGARRIRRILRISFLLIIFFAKPSAGQVSVQPSAGKTPEQIVKEVIMGNGVTITNVKFNGRSNILSENDAAQFGTFTCSGSQFFSSGIILCTGKCKAAEGPNNDNGKTDRINVSHTLSCPELSTAVSPYQVNLPAVLEFDFSSITEHVIFRYIFASEEYPEYSCSPFNDVFGFYVTDLQTHKTKNIALIPGTNKTVSVNNVHPDNGNGCRAVHEELLTMVPFWSPFMQFDGYVGPLIAEVDLESGHTYHMKLAIANVTDFAFESAVFIEAQSFNAVDDMGIIVKGNGEGNGKENAGETAAPPQTDTLSERVAEGIPSQKLRSGDIQTVALNDPDQELDINPDDYDISAESEYDYLIDDVTASVEDGSVHIRFRAKSRFCDCFFPEEIPFNVIMTPKVGASSPEGPLKRIILPVVVPVLEREPWLSRCLWVVIALLVLLLFLAYLRALLKKNRFHKHARIRNSYVVEGQAKETVRLGKPLRKPGLLAWLNRWLNPFTDEKCKLSFNRPKTGAVTFVATESKNRVGVAQSSYDPRSMTIPNYAPAADRNAGKKARNIPLSSGTAIEIKKTSGRETTRLGHLQFIIQGKDDERLFQTFVLLLILAAVAIIVLLAILMIRSL